MEILAFKILRKAKLGKEEKLLVLTGMNYEHKETLYEEAKTSLQKFKSDITEGQRGSGSVIKLEPAYLAENEEALLAHVVKSQKGQEGVVMVVEVRVGSRVGNSNRIGTQIL